MSDPSGVACASARLYTPSAGMVIHEPITFPRHDGSVIRGSWSCRFIARLTVLMMVVVGIGAGASGAAGSGKRPEWVTGAARGVEFYFRHDPRVARVEWGVGAKRRWVRVIFRGADGM